MSVPKRRTTRTLREVERTTASWRDRLRRWKMQRGIEDARRMSGEVPVSERDDPSVRLFLSQQLNANFQAIEEPGVYLASTFLDPSEEAPSTPPVTPWAAAGSNPILDIQKMADQMASNAMFGYRRPDTIIMHPHMYKKLLYLQEHLKQAYMWEKIGAGVFPRLTWTKLRMRRVRYRINYWFHERFRKEEWDD